MKIGIVGASGYSGGELIRIASSHPEFTIHYLAAGSQSGSLVRDLHPQLINFGDRRFEETSVDRINECDLVFFALPHGASAQLIQQIDPKVKIVDLGADFRLHSESAWQKYYGGTHAGTWVYGLPEIPGQREKISTSTRIANPGCYATSIALACAPAISASVIDSEDIVVVAASGTTGAGRKPSANLLASEVMGSLSSYKFGGVHQHTPEIEETLSLISGAPSKISFTPILAPLPRGILATITAKLFTQIDSDAARDIYAEFYRDEEFVTVLPTGSLPHTSAVVGSNSVLLQVAVDDHTNRLIVSAAIDNLGKGAASAAIQNANLISGLPENMGLSAIGIGS